MTKDTITYRRTSKSDLLNAFNLIISSVNHLRAKNGMRPFKVKLKQPPPLLIHQLKSDPKGSFVAFDKSGKLIGFAISIVREEEWYLADLFVAPAYQSKGVGMKLLNKALAYGKESGCRRFALCTFAYNPQAIAVYAKLGMMARLPILLMHRSQSKGKSLPKVKQEVRLQLQVVEDVGFINKFTKLDKKARGIGRPEEHFYWLGNPDVEVLAFFDGKKLAGYSTLNKRGLVAPIVAAEPQYLSSIMAMSIERGLKIGLAEQLLFVPAVQDEIVSKLLAAGFRILEVNLLMSTEMLGDPIRYIPADLSFY